MSFFSRWLKPKKQEVSQKERTVDLKSSSEGELLKLASSSENAGLREDAIKTLPYGKALLDLALGEHPVKVKQLARQQVGQYLEAEPSRIQQLRQEQSLTQSDLIDVASFSSAAIEQVISGINEEEVLVKVSLQGVSTSVRQAAARRIRVRDNLEILHSKSKGKDKSVFKIVKEKLDVFKEADAKQEALREKAVALCVSIENLKRIAPGDGFAQRLEQLESQWQALSEDAKLAVTERFQSAADACNQNLKQVQEEEQREKEQQAQKEHVKRSVSAACDQVRTVVIALYESSDADLEQSEATIKGLDEQVNAIKSFAKQDDFKAYFSIAESAKQLILELRQSGSLASLLAALKEAEPDQGRGISRKINSLLRYKKVLSGKLPTLLEEAVAAVDSWNAASKQKVEEEKKHIKDLNGLLRKANWAVEEGRVRQARGIFKELQEKREALPELPQGMVTRFEDLQEAISKLGDWHEFAVLPKKEALVEEMEALANSTLHPKELAEKIKTMQAEWKTLSKGGENKDSDLWERLQKAADIAFEPCRAYFDEQDKQREENAEKRQGLIVQMEDYYKAYPWENLVWKDVEQTMTVARDTWKAYWPVPRDKVKPLQKTFDQVMDNIYGKLKDARSANQEAKKKIIERAEQLNEAEDVPSAIEDAKKLQAEWKALGGVGGRGRAEDQKLWKAFRAACDLVFEKREQEYQARQSERDQELTKANAVIEKLDAVLSKSGDEFSAAKKNLDAIKQEFHAIGDLPKAEHAKVRDAFNKKLTAISDKTQQERSLAIKKSWESVYEIAGLLRDYEEAVLKGEGQSESQDAANAAMEENQNWPKGSQDILQARLKSIQGLKVDPAKSEETLRLICIRQEILRGEESPEQDKTLRMSYQVEQLQQGFGQQKDANTTPESLALEWLAVPGAPEHAYRELFERFSR